MKITNVPTSNNVINNNKANKNVAFGANPSTTLTKAKNAFLELAEPQRLGNMSRNMFIAAGFSFLLSGRLINSRDNNERRETLTRDVPTIVLAVQGVPIVENIVAKIIEKKTGFAITTKKLTDSGKIKREIPPGVQLKDWYIYDEQLQSGFKGFSDRLSNLGGNLKKVYSNLNQDIKSKLAKLSNDNATFMDKLSKDKSLQQTIETELKSGKNNVVKQASYLKAVPKLMGIVGTLGFIGIFIPMLNIFITEMVNTKAATAHVNKHTKKA